MRYYQAQEIEARPHYVGDGQFEPSIWKNVGYLFSHAEDAARSLGIAIGRHIVDADVQHYYFRIKLVDDQKKEAEEPEADQ